MIKSIDDLQIPQTLSGNAELFDADSQRRTGSGRLIIKMSSFEKWRATLNYEGRALLPNYRKALYAKCREMRHTAKPVTFISPYDGLEYTVQMICTKPFPPKLLAIIGGNPYLYGQCGATFEEV